MSGDSENPGEQQSLGSWHPAHMPQSGNAIGIINQPTEDVPAESPASDPPIIPSPRASQRTSPLPDYPEEVGSSPKPSGVKPLGHPEDSPPLNSPLFENGVGTSWDEKSTDDSGLGSLIPHDEATAKEQGTGVVNGLSFVNRTTSTAFVPDPQISAGEQLDHANLASAQTLDQDSSLQLGGGVLPKVGTLDRTNTFPVVPPLHHAQETERKPHGQSQVESIIQKDEEAGDWAQKSFHAGAPQQTDLADGAEGNFFEDSLDYGEDMILGHPIGAESGNRLFFPADDEEARFEEGLPLVPSDASPAQIGNATDSENAPAWLGDSLESPSSPYIASDHDFFGQDADSPEEAPFFKPKPLDRKTTSQVLGSLSYPPHNATHENPASQGDRLPLAHVSGGSIIASSSTVVSQTVAENSQSAEDLPRGTTEKIDEDLAAMWQAALDDDDLLDDSEAPEPGPANDHQGSPLPVLPPVHGADGRMLGFEDPRLAHSYNAGAASDRYSPAPNPRNLAPSYHSNQATFAGQQPQKPQAYNLSYSSSMPTGFGQAVAQPLPQSNAFAPSRPSMPKPVQSFADKSKGGYTSPYDLPIDASRPKKRTNLQQTKGVLSVRTSSQPPPPPRSSSMYATSPSSDGPLPPVPPVPGSGSSLPPPRPPSSNIKDKPSVGSFFEELPVTKSRPPSSVGRYAPAAVPQITNRLPPRPELPRQMSVPPQPNPNPTNAASSYQLVPPEQHSPYANVPQQESTNTVPSPLDSRYSPAPGLQSHVPPLRNRYAASPGTGSRPPSSLQAVPFQPRTSSPLAQKHTAPQEQHRQSLLPNDLPVRSHSPQAGVTSQKYAAADQLPALSQVEEHLGPSAGRNIPGVSAEEFLPDPHPTQKSLYPHSHLDNVALRSSPSTSGTSTFGTSTFTPESEQSLTSPDLRSQFPIHLQTQPRDSTDRAPPLEPPRRSQTQSPGAARPKPDAVNRMKDAYQRPVSASGRLSPIRAEPSISSSYAPSSRIANGSSNDLNYIRPTDGREHDPLERWKGAPILKFGFGGAIVTSFPKHIPRYAAGHGFPMIKCNPGEVKVQMSNIGTLDEDVARFPGPLKSKGKKKEVVEWLQRKVDSLETNQGIIKPSSLLPDPVRKHEEKILLWKVMKVFVENDGTIAGNSKAEQAVRAILCPDVAESGGQDPSSAATGGLSSGISKHDGSQPIPRPTDPSALESVRKLLLQGEREKAVWHAVDQRMWAHAMVLASSLDKSVWKQVLHEFTRLEVKTHGENTESLAAIYEVFAGNWDESVDQLVPPSARAGLQLVSKAASAGPTRNALDGLDRWRETLALILSNRTQDDENALVALSHLLAGYSRIEAAHLCLVFAQSTGIFGGTEDAQASVALLGADHQQQPFDYGRDLDSVLLTEVYEFVRSVLAPSASLSVSPHLQSYKLYHATVLAEHGYRSEAQQYCDAILATLKSTTKPSPYYHTLLFNALDDLMERLQQAPRDASSWMSKPMDKVSGSMWKKLNNFIVGDESDTASVASGKGDQDAGPFARVTADTPSISRIGSTADLYGAFGSQAAPPPPAATAFGSRYAPSNQYAPAGQLTPRSSLEQQGRPSEEHQRPGQSSMLRPSQPQHPYPSNQSRYTASPAPQPDFSNQQQKPRYQPSPRISPKLDSDLPTPPSQPEYMPIAPPDDPSASLYPQEPYQPSAPLDPQAPQSPAPDLDAPSSFSYQSPASTYHHSESAYEPPSSYAPYNPEGHDNQNPADQRSPKKKKSFMDDDDNDDFAARAAAILRNGRAQNDREADDAFRKAAEADGMIISYFTHLPFIRC